MRLREYEGKELFADYGIAVQPGIVARTAAEAAAAAEEIGYPVVIKAQVLTGGRGKAGGIKFADNREEVVRNAGAVLGMSINKEVADAVLITGKCRIARELYAGITIDPYRGLPVLIFSASGGVEIEQVARSQPEKLQKIYLYPTRPVRKHELTETVRKAGLDSSAIPQIVDALWRLISLFYDKDATTAEINPLVITEDGACLALDSKIVIDDSALKRQAEFQPEEEALSPLEARARAIDVAYVPLSGDIAIIAGGAGLALATMDLVSHFNGKPASFLDTGGGISSDRMAEALRISLAEPAVRGVVVNVFGGINNCEKIARGIAQVVDADKPAAAIVVKMRGHSQDEGWKLLEDREIPLVKYGTTEEAVQLLIDIMERRRM